MLFQAFLDALRAHRGTMHGSDGTLARLREEERWGTLDCVCTYAVRLNSVLPGLVTTDTTFDGEKTCEPQVSKWLFLSGLAWTTMKVVFSAIMTAVVSWLVKPGPGGAAVLYDC